MNYLFPEFNVIKMDFFTNYIIISFKGRNVIGAGNVNGKPVYFHVKSEKNLTYGFNV